MSGWGVERQPTRKASSGTVELSIFCTEYESTEQPNVDWGRVATKKMCFTPKKMPLFCTEPQSPRHLALSARATKRSPLDRYVMRPKRCLPGLDSHSSEDPHDPVD